MTNLFEEIGMNTETQRKVAKEEAAFAYLVLKIIAIWVVSICLATLTGIWFRLFVIEWLMRGLPCG